MLRSVLKPSWKHLGSLRKAFWSLQNDFKPSSESVKIVFSLDTSFKNEVWNNMLPKHTMATSCRCAEAVWRASKASWSQIGHLRKASWKLQNLISAGQRASKKSIKIFPGSKKHFFGFIEWQTFLKDVLYENTTFDVSRGDFLDNPPDFLDTPSKIDIWKWSIAQRHRCDIL